jgi:cystatin-C
MHRTFLPLLSIIAALSAGCASEPVPGGYTKASVKDKEVVAAAKFAITAQAKAMPAPERQPPAKLELVRVMTAEQQVVAGMNYRLILSVKENGTPKTAEAVIWSQPWRKPNPYELTSWTWKEP